MGMNQPGGVGLPPPISGYLDGLLGSVQGALAVRGNDGWKALPPGTAGQYLKANGAAADLSFATPASGALEFVSSTAFSGASLAITGLSLTGYDLYMTWEGIQTDSGTGRTTTIEFGYGGTPTYPSGKENVGYWNNGTWTAFAGTTGLAYITSDNTDGACGVLEMIGAGLSTAGGRQIFGYMNNPTLALVCDSFWGWRTDTNIITAVKFTLSTGNYTAGNVLIYRRKRSA